MQTSSSESPKSLQSSPTQSKAVQIMEKLASFAMLGLCIFVAFMVMILIASGQA